MATTTAAANASAIPTIWSTDLYAQAEDRTFWSKFEGPEGSNSVIIRRDDLTKDAGDTIKIDLVLALDGDGITGELSALEGNEDELKFRTISVPMNDFGKAVAWTFKANQQINHDVRATANGQLVKWLAGRFDDRIFSEFTGVSRTGVAAGNTTIPTSGIVAAGTATSRATIADSGAGGRMTLASLTELKAYAQADQRIEPIRVDGDGNEYFGLVAHDYAIMQLKRDDTSWAQAQRDAQMRGGDNPLFTGAVGIWDGVIIYRNARVPRYTNGTVQVSDNVFFGEQALSRGFCMYPNWVEEEFDYKRKGGVATTTMVGEKLNAFDLTANGGAAASAFTAVGSVVFYTSAVAPSQP